MSFWIYFPLLALVLLNHSYKVRSLHGIYINLSSCNMAIYIYFLIVVLNGNIPMDWLRFHYFHQTTRFNQGKSNFLSYMYLSNCSIQATTCSGVLAVLQMLPHTCTWPSAVTIYTVTVHEMGRSDFLWKPCHGICGN